MKLLKRILLAFTVLVVIGVVAVYIHLQNLKPILNGSLQLPGLKDEVDVWFDPYGIPHIYAQHEEDAYYALGYVHAQDRLFQMEMLRRAAGGRLSEVLGPDLLPVDKLFRTLGLNQFAKEHAEKYLLADSIGFQKAALAYLKGVNQYVKDGKTPIEFTIIGIPKEEFTPKDIYLTVGFMAFGFAEGFNADPVLEKIRTELGDDYLRALAVQTPPDAELIKNYKGNARKQGTDKLVASIQDALERLPIPQWQGSNGWVVSSEKSATGHPILSNDTHIGFSQPAVWYEAHLEYPGFSFYGHHLAGFPLGLLGNNRFCSFGLTMFENDDVDFFVENVKPDNPDKVQFGDTWEHLYSRNEIIRVKGEEDVVFEIRSSRHGPIINGIIENTDSIENPVAVSWQLLTLENHALEAAYQMNRAASLEDMQRAVSMFTAPGLNVMYGDTDGNIAWWAAARLPVRPEHTQSKLFLDGASGEDEYLGYYDFSKNPQAINPPWGYVYSANNQPDSVDGVLYPGYYYPKSRSGRIVELLSEKEKYSVDDLSMMALDMTSRMNAEIAKKIAAILEASSSRDQFSAIANQLLNWSGEDNVNSTAPSVYYNILSQIMFHAMEDEIGSTALRSLLKTSVPKNSYLMFINAADSPWWDDVNTPEKETREEIVLHSAEHTVELLTRICGHNAEDWTWGKIHTLTHAHALGAVKPLDRFFNVGPFAVHGGSEVLNNLHFKLDNTGYFHVDGGPALRKTTDLGDIENGVTVSPTGQSGNVMSPHYSDQARMFADGKFRKMLMNRQEIERVSMNRLTLKP